VGGVQDGWSIDLRDGSPESDLLLQRGWGELLPLADRVVTRVRSPNGKEFHRLPRSDSDCDPAVGNPDTDGNTNPDRHAAPTPEDAPLSPF
jgi:hypothetical protein